MAPLLDRMHQPRNIVFEELWDFDLCHIYKYPLQRPPVNQPSPTKPRRRLQVSNKTRRRLQIVKPFGELLERQRRPGLRQQRVLLRLPLLDGHRWNSWRYRGRVWFWDFHL